MRKQTKLLPPKIFFLWNQSVNQPFTQATFRLSVYRAHCFLTLFFAFPLVNKHAHLRSRRFIFLNQERSAPATVGPAQLATLVNDGYLSASATLARETRVALAPPLFPPLYSPVNFGVELPMDPILRFAIAVAAADEPGSNLPVEFRISAVTDKGEKNVFHEALGRQSSNQWLDREVRLTPWAGAQIRLIFEALALFPTGESRDISPLWGNPLVTSIDGRNERPNNFHGLLPQPY